MPHLPSRPARLSSADQRSKNRRGTARANTIDLQRFLDELEPGAHIEQLISCLPDTNYFAKNREGQFVLMDEGFLAMLGCKHKEDVLGKTDFDFFPKDLARKYVSDDRRVLTTGQPLRLTTSRRRPAVWAWWESWSYAPSLR